MLMILVLFIRPYGIWGTKPSSGCNGMINREAGVFQTSYRSDMALYTLPLAKITVWVTLGLLLILPPLLGNNAHAMSIVNTIALALSVLLDSIFSMGTRARSLLGRGPSWRWGVHRGHFVEPLRHAVLVWDPGRWRHGCPGRRLFGIPSLRIKGLYLAIATLAAQLIIEWTINHVQWIGGGAVLDLRQYADAFSGWRSTMNFGAIISFWCSFFASLLCGPKSGAFAGWPGLHCYP